MSNAELVQKLSDGYTVREIAKDKGHSHRYFERQLYRLRVESNTINNAHLVAQYLRKGLIT